MTKRRTDKHFCHIVEQTKCHYAKYMCICINIQHGIVLCIYIHSVLISCAVRLHHRHARNHRTDALLQDYGSSTLREMQFVGNGGESWTHHAQLMITSSTLLNSPCGQLCNAQKMKWINSLGRQNAKAVMNPSSYIYSPSFSSASIWKSIPEYRQHKR